METYDDLLSTISEEVCYELSPSGNGVHWPDVDEDISVKAFLGF